MITRVRIQNFQSLVDVDVTLGKLTVLSGPSNSGKSAFVRAVRVLLSNPKGDWYKREGATTPTRAGLAVVDDVNGTTIESHVNIHRGKQVAYSLEERAPAASADPVLNQDFTAVGTSVPDPVSAALRMDPVLQVPDQFDRPYLLFEAGSIVAKSFGVITESDRLMKAVHHATTVARESKSMVGALTDLIVRDRNLLESRFGWYAAAAADLVALHPLRKDLEAFHARLSRLRVIREGLAPLLVAASWETPAEASSLAELLRWAEIIFDQLEALHRIQQRVEVHAHDLGEIQAGLDAGNALMTKQMDEQASFITGLTSCPTCGQEIPDMDVAEHVISHV